MKRKTLKNLLALLATLSCVFGAAAVSGCANGGENNSSSVSSSITLVDFKDETVDVAYGKTYTLQLTAEDDKGNMQSLKATVTTKDGKPVDVLNGKFVVLDKDGYVIEYKFENGEKTITRKVTLNVVALAKPVIEVDGQTSAVISGRNYIIPTCTVIDYYDGELTPTVEIYKKSTDGNDVKVEYDAEHGVYTTSEAGEYYVLYSATNSAQKQGEKRLTFYVRESAEAGEWDSFDDIGCEYSISQYDSLKSLTYLDTFEGREGVVCMAMSDANYGAFWGVEPKSFNVEDYENYKYIAISAYLAGEASDLLNVRFMTDCLITDAKANEWKTYYFDAASWIKRIGAGTIAESALQCVGSVFGGDTKMYLDSIYFVNEVELDGCTFEQTDDGVKPVFEDTEALPDSYKVTFNGRVLPVYNGFFKADYVGDYVIEPVYTNSDKISFDTFTYTESGDTLKLNAYDKEIGASATTYVEPDVTAIDGNGAEVEGYSITKKVVYLDTVGVERTVLTVNPAKKGWYTYTFTAKADGKKSLETSATVKVGDFIDGEILNVSDADAPKRFSSMFTGGTFETFALTTENNETEGLPASYVGKTFIKLAYDTQYTYTTNNSYINFNSVMTKQEINDSVDNKVGFKLYVKAKAMDGVETMPNVTFDFLGEKTTLKLNAENTMHCSYATLLARYNKLSIHTTWADYAMAISTEIRKFAELTFYFDNIVTYEETDLPYAVRVTQENKSIIYNSDIPGVFVASDSDELSSFTGGYTGNAIKMYVATNPNYKFKNVYKPSQLKEIAKEYNTVSLWMAVGNFVGDGAVYCWAEPNSFVTKAASGQNFVLRKADNMVWKKFSISMKEYISILEKTNYEYVQIARTGGDGVISPANEKAYFYFGDVEFSYEKPTILKVTATNAANVSFDQWNNASFVAAGSADIKDFTGDYNGNAAKIKRWINNGYRFINPYTLEELAEIKTKYSTVSVWIAMDKLTSGTVRLYAPGENNGAPDTFLNKAGWAGWENTFFAANPTANNHLASARWHKVTISIDDYIDLVTAEDGTTKQYCQLFAAGQNESVGGEYFYVGDVEFGDGVIDNTIDNGEVGGETGGDNVGGGDDVVETLQDHEIIKITNEENAYNYYLNSENKSVFVPAADMSNFTGDYDGNATKIKTWINTYKFKNTFTAQTIAEKAKDYDTVSVWISSQATGTGYVCLMSWENTFMYYALGGVNKALSVATNGQWVKYSIAMDDFITLLEANGYAEYCPLVYAWGENFGGDFYFGDMFFEKAATDEPENGEGVANDSDIIKIVDTATAESFNNYLDPYQARLFVSAKEMQENGFTGDYTGNATKMNMYSTTYGFKNTFTAETIQEKAKKYNTVSIWVTTNGITDETGYMCMFDGQADTFMNYTLNGNKSVSAATNGVWVKYSISMDDFITLLEANNYGEYCKLIYCWGEGFSGHFYFGDMFFENV